MHNPDAPNNAKMPWFERLFAPLRAFLHRRRLQPIQDPRALRDFLQSRASYVAQMTLYGYLRTRSGVRFPELFNNDEFVASVNIAKWHVWLACLSDLAVYLGGMLRRSGKTDAEVGRVMQQVVGDILSETGVPADAGPEYTAHADRVRSRIALCPWAAQVDGDGPFVESPGALVFWAPIVDELKVLDEEIVRNSVRFRWNEIREQARRALDAQAVMASASSP
jgi:hypothetical protein